MDEGCQWAGPGWHFATDIWGTGTNPEAIWSSATQGDVMKRRWIGPGYTWDQIPTGVPVDLTDIWGTSSANIYAVGEVGTVVHFTGAVWNPVPGIPTIQTLNAVWGSGPDDIFVVGDWGTILHYDGVAWVEQNSGITKHLFDVWGINGANVYAVGIDGTILHYDGANWQTEASGVTMDLLAVWGVTDSTTGQNIIWSAGAGPIVLKKTVVSLLFLPVQTRPQ